MDNTRASSTIGKSMILVGVLLVLLVGLWTDLVVDHRQVYELESWDGFSAGVNSLNDSFSPWVLDQQLTWKVGEAHLDLGEHALWVERLDGTDTMWDVVQLHIEDDGDWVVYHRPTRPRTIERDGVKYELMFTFDVASPGNYTIESMGSVPALTGEEVHIIITHNIEPDPLLLLPGLAILLCGIVLIVHEALRREQGANPT